jgi:gas vesicle protein
MANKSKLPTLLLAGIAAGAAAYYLLATDEGKKTCDSFVNSFKELSDSLMDKANETVASVKEKINTV